MFTFRQGCLEDIDELTRLRIEFLTEMGNINYESAIPELKLTIYRYFKEEINKGFFCWIAEQNGIIVGTSGLVFQKKPPLSGNLTGIDGYIMNMYTIPSYRKKGIAERLLNEIIEFLKDREIYTVSLHATNDGRKLYEKVGFIAKDSEMVLKLENC
jgi:GNAT superfamily N-acetyltransferase